jgi:hypothetical protein
MSVPHQISHRIAATVAAGCAGLVLASTAGAVDLRDWGRKFSTSERFVVLSQFNNQAVLDKETQLVWQAVADTTPAITGVWSQAHFSCLFDTAGSRRGWRLPTYPEIASIFGTNGVKPQAFNGVPNGLYWTATEYAVSDAYAVVIDVPSGAAAIGPVHLKSDKLRIWCVRGPA